MYKTYFGLKENPFSINTDPRYLYMTQRTQQALSCLAYGIESRKGFILLTGEVGTGKTTLLNKLLESLHQQGVATAFVFNARPPDCRVAAIFVACPTTFLCAVQTRLLARKWTATAAPGGALVQPSLRRIREKSSRRTLRWVP